jgi:hypothetical protein
MSEKDLNYFVQKLELSLRHIVGKEPKYLGRVTKDLIRSDKNSSSIIEWCNEEGLHNTDTIVIEVFIRLERIFDADLRYDDEVELIIGSNGLSNKYLHQEWDPPSSGPRWMKHREYLTHQFDRKPIKNPVNSIDIHTNKILKLMENPKRSTNFNSRGLVLGYIQSGKTANFSALISKAADAGYKLIVVLSGIHEILRNQTQKRLGKEIIGYSSEGGHITYTSEDASIKWTPLTSTSDPSTNGDFRSSYFSLDDHFKRNDTLIAIMKKQKDVLGKFLAWVNKCDPQVLMQIPILLIDDEGDQASLDASPSRDSNVSTINGLITEILKKFPKAQYVAYTATPFANILSDMTDKNQLFPKNFIYPLPKQGNNYFGTEEIFNKDNRHLYIVTDGVREPIPKKKESIKNPTITLPITLTLTKDIRRSIITFLLTSVIRIFRLRESDKNDEPMSMIVHIYRENLSQGGVHTAVKEFLEILMDDVGEYEDEIKESFENLVKSSQAICTHLNIEERDCGDYSEVCRYMKNQLIKNIDTIKLNSIGKDTLDYDAKPNAKIIAIGGDKLSRGLTLEGLSTSHYVRNSKQYDTLLQMGRWFGYRSGYIDLMRVFTTQPIMDNFTKISKVEMELRHEIERMIDEELIPHDFNLYISKINGLKPTGRTKMKHATDIAHNIGRTASSVVIPSYLNTESMDKNHNAFLRLVQKNESNFMREDKNWVAYKQSSEDVLELVSSFETIPEKREAICGVIENLKQKEWNIAIMHGRGNQYTLPNTNISINKPKRTLKGVSDSELGPNLMRIKNISGQADRIIDGENDELKRMSPLLLLYFAESDDPPTEVENNSNFPVCLFTCVFPSDSPHFNGYINIGHLEQHDSL